MSQDSSIDQSTLKTAEGQSFAASMAATLAEGKERVRRLFRVLHDWIIFDREAQLGLTEAAICWVTAAIASNDRRDECQTNLYCFVDSMYVSTQDAANTLDQSERGQIAVAAAAVQRHVSSALPRILSASAEQIKAAFPNSLPLNVVTELHAMRRRLQSELQRLELLARRGSG